MFRFLFVALVSLLAFSLVLRTCLVVFGLFDYLKIVFFNCFWIVFGFVSIIVGFVWLFFVCVGGLGSRCCCMLC